MSLINKMLQDLDARGTPGAESIQVHVKPVTRDERALSIQLVVALAVGAVAIGLAGGFGWRYLHKQAATSAPQVPPAVVAPAPVQPAPAPIIAAPQPTLASASPPAPGAAEPPRKEDAAATKAAHRTRMEHGRNTTSESKAAKESKQAAAMPKRQVAAAPARAGRQETPGQIAEGAYRRALASLQEGRVNEAIGALEQALQADPKHDAARQTLVGLLVENKRGDEAVRQLQLGLALDPRQPALAMLLARLQIERGGSGIDTLMRTLPFAAGNGGYHAFLAGALQRQQRHREAAEQYQAALRTQPQNGVWWMGLGISLQADKRNGEALDAFQKAKAAGTLSPELQAFVERKLGQLGR